MTSPKSKASKIRHKVASVGPPTGPADELLDQLVAFRPIEVKALETARGATEATVCQVVSIDQNGAMHNPE